MGKSSSIIGLSETCKLDIALSPEQIVEKMREHVRPGSLCRRWAWGWQPWETFRGKVDENGFKITRDVRGRASFVPTIEGTFDTHGPTKTTLTIRMCLWRSVRIFLAIWMAIPLFTALSILGASEFPLSRRLGMVVVVMMFVAFGWGLMFFCFRMARKDAKCCLMDIFKDHVEGTWY